MIPPEKQDAVDRGLRQVFGTTEVEDVSPITSGRTASLVFRVIVRGSPYLLKLMDSTRMEDPARHYANMTVAAEAGLAPRVLYASVPDHVAITDFVNATPLSRADALARLPAVLRALHALPPFAKAPFNTTCTFLLTPSPMRDGFLEKFRAANLLPPADQEQFFALHTELFAAYRPEEVDLASSHNDLFKPDNILFDGQRVWLVDWEAAFLSDRYADLAVVANQIVASDEEEGVYLEAYLGATPTGHQRAQLHLMRQSAHLFYTMAFLFQGAAGRAIDWSTPIPTFEEYRARAWAGDVDLADKDVKITYGRVQWARLLHNVQQARYRDAIRHEQV